MANPSKQDSQLADSSDNPMIGAQQALVSDPTGGATTDAEARAAIVSILDILEAHGLMADS
jgi:hypothetical protein